MVAALVAASGPVIVPGNYTVRLAAGGKTMTQPLTVLIDPREAKDGVTIADLREQFQHNMQRPRHGDRGEPARGDRRERAPAPQERDGRAADTLRKLDELHAKVVTAAIRYSKPELQAHIQYLYSLTTQADQKIGRDAVERLRVLRTELDQRQSDVRALLGAKVVQ